MAYQPTGTTSFYPDLANASMRYERAATDQRPMQEPARQFAYFATPIACSPYHGLGYQQLYPIPTYSQNCQDRHLQSNCKVFPEPQSASFRRPTLPSLDALQLPGQCIPRFEPVPAPRGLLVRNPARYTPTRTSWEKECLSPAYAPRTHVSVPSEFRQPALTQPVRSKVEPVAAVHLLLPKTSRHADNHRSFHEPELAPSQGPEARIIGSVFTPPLLDARSPQAVSGEQAESAFKLEMARQSLMVQLPAKDWNSSAASVNPSSAHDGEMRSSTVIANLSESTLDQLQSSEAVRLAAATQNSSAPEHAMSIGDALRKPPSENGDRATPCTPSTPKASSKHSNPQFSPSLYGRDRNPRRNVTSKCPEGVTPQPIRKKTTGTPKQVGTRVVREAVAEQVVVAAAAEQVAAEQVAVEKMGSEQSVSRKIVTEQRVAEQVEREQTAVEQTAPEQAMVEEASRQTTAARKPVKRKRSTQGQDGPDKRRPQPNTAVRRNSRGEGEGAPSPISAPQDWQIRPAAAGPVPTNAAKQTYPSALIECNEVSEPEADLNPKVDPPSPPCELTRTVDLRPNRNPEGDRHYVMDMMVALALQVQAKKNTVHKMSSIRILDLLCRAEYPSESEAKFLSNAEAEAEVGPNSFYNGPIITTRQQTLPLQTVSQFLAEYYEDDPQIFIQDGSAGRAKNQSAVKQIPIKQVKERFLGKRVPDQLPWNCLELATHHEDGLRPHFLNQEDCRLLTKLKIPSAADHSRRRTYELGYKEVEKWALLAQAGALTEPHQDSHGYSTYITLNQGTVGFGWLSNPSDEERAAWRKSPQTFTGGRWRYVILRLGQTIFFPAGTVHMVFRLPSAGDSLAFGGHVLRCSNIVHWVKTLIEERDNANVTNEDLTDSASFYLGQVERFVRFALSKADEEGDDGKGLERWGGREKVEEFLKLKREFERRKQRVKKF